MKSLIRLIDRLNSFSGALAGLMLLGALAMICTEIVLRSFFHRTLYITDEYMGYLMCGLTFCALGYTLKEKGHIRMTLLFQSLGTKWQQFLNIVCFSIGFFVTAYLSFICTSFFWDSVVTKSQSIQISATYLAIPQFFMPLGATMLALQFLAELLRSIFVLRGDTEGLMVLEESEELGR